MSRAKIPSTLQAKVRRTSEERCGYCQSPQPLVMSLLEVEHIIPIADGGTNDEGNLWLACSLCNRHKGAQTSAFDPVTNTLVLLFNPRKDNWQDNFRWAEDGVSILGQTATGRATIEALRLNNELAVEVRRNWVLAGWHPPTC
jgi:hypothetical protein